MSAGGLLTVRGLLAELTPADRGVAVGLVALAGALAAGLALGARAPARAVVTVGRDTVATLPLDAPIRRTFEGRISPVVVVVEHGSVRVTESGCPHRICVAMGAKSRAGEVVACVPNALLVRLEGGRASRDAPDSVSR